MSTTKNIDIYVKLVSMASIVIITVVAIGTGAAGPELAFAALGILAGLGGWDKIHKPYVYDMDNKLKEMR